MSSVRNNIACALLTDLADQKTELEMLEPYLTRVGAEALSWTKSDPDLDSLRGDRRFAEMISQAEARLGGQDGEPAAAP